MREIKFRYWEKPDTSVNFEGKMHYGSDEYFNKWCGHPEYETMQFTGLFDRHGKEIFENDIVKIDSWEPKIHEVVFDRGAFCFRSSKDDRFYNDCKYLEQGEVIGNVFENPELLTNIN